MNQEMYYLLGVVLLVMIFLYARFSTVSFKQWFKKTILKITGSSNGGKKLLRRFIESSSNNMLIITSLYNQILVLESENGELPTAAEWILDNYHIISEKEQGIISDDFRNLFVSLPRFENRDQLVELRIYSVAIKIVSLHEGRISEANINDYLENYQKHTILTEREIDILPQMIAICLIEKIADYSKDITSILKQWKKVDQLIEQSQSNKNVIEDTLNKLLKEHDVPNTQFVKRLYDVLRGNGLLDKDTSQLIRKLFSKIGTDITETINQTTNFETQLAFLMGNLITSLKEHTFIEWAVLQKNCSSISNILSHDPEGIYLKMSLETQLFYRKKVSSIALLMNRSEMQVAEVAIALAKASKLDKIQINPAHSSVSTHVGYYLIDDGLLDLKNQLVHKEERKKIGFSSLFDMKKRVHVYLLLLILLTTFLAVALGLYNPAHFTGYLELNFIITILLIWIPLSEAAIHSINYFTLKQTEPYIFPALALEEGILPTMKTMIVIPTLLSSINTANQILETLESHYLLNREENLTFAIVGAFKDAQQEHLSTDMIILNHVIQAITDLNLKYGKRFAFFQRARTYNSSNRIWIGWERKRGAITELNEFLMGKEQTSFVYPTKLSIDFKEIKYILTLDSDTILPMNMAKRMIAVMEHPLNKPIIDPVHNIVIKGYGILQPKISTDIESASSSIFSRIFSNQLGFDPYSGRSSSLYQDFFRQGIYTGKGIYNLKVFQEVLEHAIPENSVLSHDLLEGSYLRTAYVSELELVDNFPQTYITHALRQYRWVRGDWQLFPFILSNRKDIRGMKIRNPLSLLAKWQLIDNLRRSLVAPFLMLMIYLSVAGVMERNIFAWVFIMVIIFFPAMTNLPRLIVRLLSNKSEAREALQGFLMLFVQCIMTVVFLPYQAWLMIKAISVTLMRMMVTKRNMLQWTTSSAVDVAFKNTLLSYWRAMMSNFIQIFILVILYVINKPFTVFVVLPAILLWSVSFIVAYLTGRDVFVAQPKITTQEREELGRIARKTWHYFETFMTKENHYLIPDNYQESPLKSTDNRTSPTNIGLSMAAVLSAFDFGYIEAETLFEQTEQIMETLEMLPKWHGHLFNWYETVTLKPLAPVYVSTVDSGNLAGYLIVLKEGLHETITSPLSFLKFIAGIEDTLLCLDETVYFGLDKFRATISSLSSNPTICEIITEIHPRLTKELEEVTSKDLWLQRIKDQTQTNYNVYKELFPFALWVNQMPKEIEKLTESHPLYLSISLLYSSTDFPNLLLNYKHCIQQIELILDRFSLLHEFSNETLIWLTELSRMLQEVVVSIQLKYDKYKEIVERVEKFYQSMDFLPLYDFKKKLFSIGFDLDKNIQTNASYDLMASEARQTSYISIAKGDIPSEHWKSLGRSLTTIDHQSGLLSWTGTMFEYLMPLIIMKPYRHTLLEQTYTFAVYAQMKYGKVRKTPWGVSESQYYAFDHKNTYQYKAIGVPWLAVSKKIVNEDVVAPYASFLALLVNPKRALENILALKDDGLEGFYGFYEAVEYEKDYKPRIVKSYMAHHQGMSLLSMNNHLHDNIMQKRFSQDRAMNAYRLLLQERIPTKRPVTQSLKPSALKDKMEKKQTLPPVRVFESIDLNLPKVHVMTNGNYSVLITDQGTGYSKIRNADITRWREDKIMNHNGMFFIIKQIKSDLLYTATYAPFQNEGNNFQVIFETDKTTFKRTDGLIETKMEISIAFEDNVEIRKISFKNKGKVAETLNITSYYEPVLTSQAADRAHQAFSNLFVETEVNDNDKCIIVKRRNVSRNESELSLAQRLIISDKHKVSFRFETDRSKIISRNDSISSKKLYDMTKQYQNSTGAVLDPAISMNVEFDVMPYESVTLFYVTLVSEKRTLLDKMIKKYQTVEDVHSALSISHNYDSISGKYHFLKSKEMILYQNVLSHLIFLSPLKQNVFVNNDMRNGRGTLWKYAISGDYPIISIRIFDESQIKLVIEALRAQQYWQILNIKVDIVIIDASTNKEQSELQTDLQKVVTKHTYQTISTHPCTVVIIQSTNLDPGDMNFLMNASRLALDGELGSLSDQVF